MTLDGYCDHTSGVPDEEVHQHYADLLNGAGTILYGRITFELMKYWQTVLKESTGNRTMDDFAVAIDKVPKLVFSRTLKDTGWDSAKLATRTLEEEILALKQQPGKDIFVGSPGLIVSTMNLGLVDECQICVHPVIAGGGLPLFKNIAGKTMLKLVKTKTFKGGAVILCYEPVKG